MSVVHVRRKKARIYERHVAPLTRLADGIAASRGLAPGAVPYPDPDHGGVEARVLFLLTAPGPGARDGSGSGLLSLENNDAGAARCHRETERVGLRWQDVVHWNVVPFPIKHERTPTAAEVVAGSRWVPDLLALLGQVRVVVLLGVVPQSAWSEADLGWSGLTIVRGPSPGPYGMMRSGASEELSVAFDEVRAALN